MKLLTSIDLTAQTVLMVATLIPAALAIFIDGIGLVSFLCALILGPWQLVSAIASTWTRQAFLPQRKLYLKLSVVYFALMGVGALLADTVTDNVASIVFVVVAVAGPVLLAVFYYVITYKTYSSTKVLLV